MSCAYFKKDEALTCKTHIFVKDTWFWSSIWASVQHNELLSHTASSPSRVWRGLRHQICLIYPLRPVAEVAMTQPRHRHILNSLTGDRELRSCVSTEIMRSVNSISRRCVPRVKRWSFIEGEKQPLSVSQCWKEDRSRALILWKSCSSVSPAVHSGSTVWQPLMTDLISWRPGAVSHSQPFNVPVGLCMVGYCIIVMPVLKRLFGYVFVHSFYYIRKSVSDPENLLL